jgi:TPR repeat protein
VSVHELKLAADQGNPLAQLNYGVCLHNGKGVLIDFKGAAHYFKLAADQGNSLAQVKYGFCLQNGKGVSKDLHGAAHYFELAAHQGHSNVGSKYGLHLSNTHGMSTDLKATPYSFELSAAHGSALGQFSVGVGLCDRKETSIDLARATQFVKLETDQQHPSEQGASAALLEGVSKDLTESARNFRLTADQGHAEAQYNLQSVSSPVRASIETLQMPFNISNNRLKTGVQMGSLLLRAWQKMGSD